MIEDETTLTQRIEEMRDCSDIDECYAADFRGKADLQNVIASLKDEELLDKFSRSRYKHVRAEVAKNIHCAERTLRRLLTEDSLIARKAQRALATKLAIRDGLETLSLESKLNLYGLEDWKYIRSRQFREDWNLSGGSIQNLTSKH